LVVPTKSVLATASRANGEKMKPTRNGRWVKDPNSAMNLIQACLDDGMTDRQEMAERTGLTRAQVGYAIRNLWIKNGKTPAPKATGVFSNVNSIFNMR
jgi:hypothetical protein